MYVENFKVFGTPSAESWPVSWVLVFLYWFSSIKCPFFVVVFGAPLSSLSLPFVMSSCQTLPVPFQTNTSHPQESEDLPGSESVVLNNVRTRGFLGETIV